ncbi:MAG: methyl-accepting chemotaxis protein, partial [Gammaproteobacteria bacterium]|nr:methyl-accepting chemotaxis protein [Gammaproteobacteria bacterium]
FARIISVQVRAAFDKVLDVSAQMQRGDLLEITVENTGDEVEDMMVALKGMVDSLEGKNQQVNNSVIELMSSVAQLSQKDLTGKAIVSEDVTGPVADAINMMVSETCKVLGEISGVSDQVEKAANTVKLQAGKATDVANKERLIVQATAKDLQNSALAMSKLGKNAHAVNNQASKAINHTRSALEAVKGTTKGIDGIREIIRETEKRIKRLGERSQEITGVVNIINNIAERTHILALNASMHAAAAGEAGRGFGTVADEVQRLAESSRESTAEISTMVNNIRAETIDTVNTMNDVITRVAEGTNLANNAAEQMKETEEVTAQLVSAIQVISKYAMNQAKSVNDLSKRSESIVKSTEMTGKELKEQVLHTDSLVQYAHSMRKSVATFKLPAV